MQLNSLLIRAVFLALPGVLGSKVYRKLRGPTEKEVWESVLEVVLFSVSSFLILALLFPKFMSSASVVSATATTQPVSHMHSDSQPMQMFLDESVPVRWTQIGAACIVAMLLTLPASYIHNYRIITLLGRFVYATKRMADEDVWELFFSGRHVKWVLVRDHKQDLAYFGYIRLFSDSRREREIVLENVSVHENASGKKLYDTKVVYVSRDKDELTVEISRIDGELESITEKESESGETHSWRRITNAWRELLKKRWQQFWLRLGAAQRDNSRSAGRFRGRRRQ